MNNKNYNSILYKSNPSDYTYLNKLYEKTFNINQEEEQDDLSKLAINEDDFDDVVKAMYDDAKNEVLKGQGDTSLPVNNVLKSNLLSPKNKNNSSDGTLDTSSTETDNKKEWKIPYLSDIKGQIISAVGSVGKTYGELDYKLDVKKANSYLKKAEKAKTEEEKQKYLDKYNKKMASAKYWLDTNNKLAGDIIDYGNNFSTIDENSGLIEKALKGSVGSLANMGVSTVLTGGNPLIGVGVSSYGAAKKEAEDMGIENATQYALINAGIEAGSELILPGTKGIKTLITTGSLKAAIKAAGVETEEEFIRQIMKEFGQEASTEAAHIIHEFFYTDGNGDKIAVDSFWDAVDRVRTAGLTGAVSAGVTEGGATMAKKSSVKNKVNNTVKNTVENTEEVNNNIENTEEIKDKIKDTQNTQKSPSILAPKSIQDLNNAFGFEAITEANLKEIQGDNKKVENTNIEEDKNSNIEEEDNTKNINNTPEVDTTPINPNAPFLNKTVDENGREVYITEEGNKVNVKLAEMAAENQGIPVETLTKYSKEQSEYMENTIKADEIIESIDNSINEEGVDNVISALNTDLENGNITEETYNTAVNYIKQRSIENNTTQQETTQNNADIKNIENIDNIENIENADTTSNVSTTDTTTTNERLSKLQKEFKNHQKNIKRLTEEARKTKDYTKVNEYFEKNNPNIILDEIANIQEWKSTESNTVDNEVNNNVRYIDDPSYINSNSNSNSNIDNFNSNIDNSTNVKNKKITNEKVSEKNGASSINVKYKETTNEKVSNTSSKKGKAEIETKKSSFEREKVEEVSKEHLDKTEKLNKVVNSKDFKNVFSNLKLEVIKSLDIEQKSVNKLGEAIGRNIIFFKADSKNAPNGFFKDNTIFLNGDFKGDAMAQVLGHETFHTLKETDAETFNKLVDWGMDNFSTREINKFLAKINNEAEVNKLRNNPKLLSEEMLAEAFGNDFANKEFWNSLEKSNKTLFDKVKEVIAKIFKDAEAKTTDFLTKKHIKELRGEFKNIFGDLTKTEAETDTKTKNGDDVKFSTRQTETEEFKKWFKDSKVVDENGKPLVVYHGTTAGIKFNKFNSNKKGKNTDNIIGYVGFNFTENTNTASAYADNELRVYNPEYHKNARVYPVYLSIQNPLIYGVNMDFSKVFDKNEISNLKEKESQFREKASELYKKRDKTKNKEEKEEFGRLAKEATKESIRYQNINWAISSGNPVALFEMHASNYYREKIDGKELEYAEKIQKELIDLGYDGIILENTKLDSPSSLLYSQFATYDANVPNELKEQDFINQYIAFYPNQIKSAISNNGSFDPNNDDIRFSTRSKEEIENIKTPLLNVANNVNDLQLRTGIKALHKIKIDKNVDLVSIFKGAIDTMASNNESYKVNQKVFKNALIEEGINKKQADAISKYFTNIIEVAKNSAEENTVKAKNVVVSSSFKKKEGSYKERLFNDIKRAYSRLSDDNYFGKMIGEEVYKSARVSTNAFSIADNILSYNLTDKDGNVVNKSLKDLFFDVFPEGREKDFINYVLHKHNISRALQEKYIFFKEDGSPVKSTDSSKIVKQYEEKHPDFASRQEQLTGWINDFMKVWAVDTGLITEDFHNLLKEMYKHYVPTNRNFDDHEELFGGGFGGKGFVDKSKPTKEASKDGSSRDIKDIKESIVNLVVKTVRTAKMNEVGQELVKAVESNPSMKNIAEIVDKPNANAHNIVRVLKDGEAVYVKVHNGDLLTMLEKLHSVEYDYITEMSKKINNGVKQLITSKNPLFAITNTVRDYQTYMVNSTEKNVLKRWKNLGKAISLIAKDIKGEDVSNTELGIYRAMGISGSGIMSKGTHKTVENLTGKKAVVDKMTGKLEGYKDFNSLKKAWIKFNEHLEILTGSPETSFRLAELIGALERGESLRDATLKAMEVTVDFSKGGDITKFADSYVKYLNAGVQGFDKFIRQSFKHPVQTLTRSLVHIAGPALLLAALNGGDDDYDMLDDRTKDNNFLIPLYLFGGEEGQYLKIPKAREYGMMAMLCERLVYGNGFKNLGRSIIENLSPPSVITDNIIYDIGRLDNDQARDFSGKYIVPYSLQGYNKKDQHDDDTTVVAKWLGQLTGLSPKKIDYYIDNYSGIIGDTLLPLLTPSTYMVEEDISTKILAPIKKKFVADNVNSSSATSNYYDYTEQLENAISSEKKSMENKGIEDYESELKDFQSYIKKEYGNDITYFNKAIKDNSLTEEEKRILKQYRNKAMEMASEEMKLFLKSQK